MFIIMLGDVMEISELPEMFKKQGMITEEKIDTLKIAIYIKSNFNVGRTVDFNKLDGYSYVWFIANKNNNLISFREFRKDIIELLIYICSVNKCKDNLTKEKINSIFSKLSSMVKFTNKKEFQKKYIGYNRHLMPYDEHM